MVPGATLGERPASPGPWFSGVIRAARNCYSTRPARRTGWPDERAPATAPPVASWRMIWKAACAHGRRRCLGAALVLPWCCLGAALALAVAGRRAPRGARRGAGSCQRCAAALPPYPTERPPPLAARWNGRGRVVRHPATRPAHRRRRAIESARARGKPRPGAAGSGGRAGPRAGISGAGRQRHNARAGRGRSAPAYRHGLMAWLWSSHGRRPPRRRQSTDSEQGATPLIGG